MSRTSPRKPRDALTSVRPDIGSIDRATARELLNDAAPVIRALARNRPGFDEEELLQVGRLGALEAHLTFIEGRGPPFATWQKQVIRWRVSEACTRIYAERTETERDAPTNGVHDPEKNTLRRELLRYMEALDPRERIILDMRLRGHTLEQIGDSLGITSSRVLQCQLVAIGHLQRMVNDDV